MTDGNGAFGKQGGRQAGYGYGVPLVANPGFLQMQIHEDDTLLTFAGIGNPLAASLQYSPGWYDFGGTDSGEIRSGSSTHPNGPTFATKRGTRIVSDAGKMKGLCVPIPMASHLHGRRLRFRAAVRSSSGDDVGFTAVLSGRVIKQVWDGPHHLGLSGAIEQTHPAGTKGIGHLISALPKPGGSTDLGDPFDTQDITSGPSTAVFARATTFNRVYDAWRTVATAGKSEITIDVPGTGANVKSEAHDVFFLDSDVDEASANYPTDTKLVELAREDLTGGAIGQLKKIDMIFDMPEAGDHKDPVHSASDCTWLCIFPLNAPGVAASQDILDVYYCNLEVLDDSVESGILASGLQGLQGGPFHLGGWAPHALAYPVYRPTRYFVTGAEWQALAGDTGWVPLGTSVYSLAPSQRFLAPLRLPCGSVVYSASVFTGSLAGASVTFALYHTSRSQLRLYNTGANLPAFSIAEGTFSTDDAEEGMGCRRNRLGTGLTTESVQSLMSSLPDGSENLSLSLFFPASGQHVFGAEVMVLVDDRLAYGGSPLRT